MPRGSPAALTGPPPRPRRSFDNSQICSGGADKAVALWDVTTGQVVRKYRGHAGVRRGRGWDLGSCLQVGTLIQCFSHRR